MLSLFPRMISLTQLTFTRSLQLRRRCSLVIKDIYVLLPTQQIMCSERSMYSIAHTQNFASQKVSQKGIFTVRSTIVSKYSTRPRDFTPTEILIVNESTLRFGFAVGSLQFLEHLKFNVGSGGGRKYCRVHSLPSIKSEITEYF